MSSTCLLMSLLVFISLVCVDWADPSLERLDLETSTGYQFFILDLDHVLDFVLSLLLGHVLEFEGYLLVVVR